jgi:hypothetical protein
MKDIKRRSNSLLAKMTSKQSKVMFIFRQIESLLVDKKAAQSDFHNKEITLQGMRSQVTDKTEVGKSEYYRNKLSECTAQITNIIDSKKKIIADSQNAIDQLKMVMLLII